MLLHADRHRCKVLMRAAFAWQGLGWPMLPWSVGWSKGALGLGCRGMWAAETPLQPTAGSTCTAGGAGKQLPAGLGWAPLGVHCLMIALAALCSHVPAAGLSPAAGMCRVHLPQALLSSAGLVPLLGKHLLPATCLAGTLAGYAGWFCSAA